MPHIERILILHIASYTQCTSKVAAGRLTESQASCMWHRTFVECRHMSSTRYIFIGTAPGIYFDTCHVSPKHFNFFISRRMARFWRSLSCLTTQQPLCLCRPSCQGYSLQSRAKRTTSGNVSASFKRVLYTSKTKQSNSSKKIQTATVTTAKVQWIRSNQFPCENSIWLVVVTPQNVSNRFP